MKNHGDAHGALLPPPVKHFLRQITSHKTGEIRWLPVVRLSDLFNPYNRPCELSLRKLGKNFKCPPSPAVPLGTNCYTITRGFNLEEEGSARMETVKD